MKTLKIGAAALLLVGTAFTLAGCADDGYRGDRGYSSVSIGVSSSSGGHRRDRDGDGVPNRYDEHPNNPYRD